MQHPAASRIFADAHRLISIKTQKSRIPMAGIRKPM